jgi:hypothetical protein
MRPGKRGNRGEAQRLGPRLDQIVDPTIRWRSWRSASTGPSSSSTWMRFIGMVPASRRCPPRACNPMGFITMPMRLLRRYSRGGSRDSDDGRGPRAGTVNLGAVWLVEVGQVA